MGAGGRRTRSRGGFHNLSQMCGSMTASADDKKHTKNTHTKTQKTTTTTTTANDVRQHDRQLGAHQREHDEDEKQEPEHVVELVQPQ